MSRLWLALAVMACLAGVARAGTPVEAMGSAQISAGDTSKARQKALDDAFRQAVDQALGALVTPEVREAQAEVIRKRVLRRAKVYVATYKVIEEGEDNGLVYQVRIEADVDATTLASDLKALGVAVLGDEPVVAPVDPAAARPKVVVLVVQRDGDLVTAGGEGEDAVRRALEARGFAVVPVAWAPSGGPSAAPPAAVEALALAAKAGTNVAVTGQVTIAAGGRIRGTRLQGATATFELAVITTGAATGAGPREVTRASATGAGFDADPALAGAMAARGAGELAGRDLARAAAKAWPSAASAGTLVTVRGSSRWPEIGEIAKLLAALPGVKQVAVWRAARGEVTLSVTGQVNGKGLATALGGATFGGFTIEARAAGGGVTVQVRAAGGGETPGVRPGVTPGVTK